jgi:predicted amidophosphoribosyltransferase
MAKEQNISAARNVLADLLVAAYVQLNVHNGEVHSLGLIPIPSSKSANRERGFRHSYLLSTELRNRLCMRFGLSVEVVEILKVNRKISDQSKLNKVERGANVHQAYSISPDRRGFIQPGRNFVLVDDLVTTGSSMKEAIRCLRAAKISPLGAISAGVSPHLIS